jgi:hypothetical protein
LQKIPKRPSNDWSEFFRSCSGMTMSDDRRSQQNNTAHLQLRAVVQIVGLIAALIWVLPAVAVFGVTDTHYGMTDTSRALMMITFMITLFGAPLFFFSVLPALIYNRWGGPSGPKVGAALLLGGVAVALALIAWASTRPVIR